MKVICDNCDEIYFNCIFDPDATVDYFDFSDPTTQKIRTSHRLK